MTNILFKTNFEYLTNVLISEKQSCFLIEISILDQYPYFVLTFSKKNFDFCIKSCIFIYNLKILLAFCLYFFLLPRFVEYVWNMVEHNDFLHFMAMGWGVAEILNIMQNMMTLTEKYDTEQKIYNEKRITYKFYVTICSSCGIKNVFIIFCIDIIDILL